MDGTNSAFDEIGGGGAGIVTHTVKLEIIVDAADLERRWIRDVTEYRCQTFTVESGHVIPIEHADALCP